MGVLQRGTLWEGEGGRREECEEVRGGSEVVGGVVSLGLILNVLQCLFVLFFTWSKENTPLVFGPRTQSAQSAQSASWES